MLFSSGARKDLMSMDAYSWGMVKSLIRRDTRASAARSSILLFVHKFSRHIMNTSSDRDENLAIASRSSYVGVAKSAHSLVSWVTIGEEKAE